MSNEHFNLIAKYYDRAGQFKVTGTLLRLLDLPANGLLLDAGGGTGRVSSALCDYVGGTVVADVSAGMLKYAHEKGLSCVRTPVENLPFATGTFERVFMLDAFHHVHNQGETARDLFRVLKPGGRLVIVEPDIHKFAVKLIALGEKLLLMRSRFMSGGQIAEMFSTMGADAQVVYLDANAWVSIQK
jgi:ubiquinone/menaquinone biosynthesis C-methylase UbiE